MPRPPIVRPTLDTTVSRQDGTVVTIADQIVELLKVGTPVELAAAAVGVTPAEYRGWMRQGLAGLSRLAAGHSWTRDFTPPEQESTAFADRVQRAIGEWASRANALLEQLQRGGYEMVSTKVKRQGTDVVEVLTTTETLAPDARVLTWRLERGFPSIYGRFATGPDLNADLSDDDSTHDVLMERLAEVGRRMHVIDVTPTDE
jgi:hypothetical protein